jgi:hypothetical protein
MGSGILLKDTKFSTVLSHSLTLFDYDENEFGILVLGAPRTVAEMGGFLDLEYMLYYNFSEILQPIDNVIEECQCSFSHGVEFLIERST